MSTVIPFKPRYELDAEKNVRDFIRHCKAKLDLYGAELDWDAQRWDVSGRHSRKGKYEKKYEMVFSALGSSKWYMQPMHELYADFAKAYMRYCMSFSGETGFANILTAVRILEASLIDCDRDGIPRVYLTDEIVVGRAVELIEQHFKTGGAHFQYGWRLQKLLEFLVEHRLVAKPFKWSSPFTPPASGTLVGAEHDKIRAAKLPSREVLAAVGTIFDSAVEERDVIVSSCLAILCSAPGRISEAVTIQNRCEVWLDNGDGNKDLGLRWYPNKGGKKGVKHLVKVMEPVVQRAIERVRAVTEEARAIARWYENNPDKLYLPEELAHLRHKERITGEELAQLVGSCSGANAPKIATQYGLTACKATVMLPNRLRKDGSRSESRKVIHTYSFAEVEQKILSYLG